MDDVSIQRMMTHSEPFVPAPEPGPPADAPPRARRSPAWVLMLPLAAYLVVSLPIGIRQLDRMNPDALVYVRRAMYLVEGNASASVSGYWSPMISWSIAPFIAAGMDGLHAARYALLLWGAAFIVAFYLLLRRLPEVPDWWKAVALTATAMVVPTFTLHQITPDVILATWLMAYFAAVMGPGFLQNRRSTLIAGLLGGIAYLAKAYAFPFVILHLPLTVLLRTFAERKGEAVGASVRRAAVSSAIALAGFAIVAAPWVAVLSIKYGHFTFSTTGKIAHAVVGPPGLPKPSPMRLERVPDPFISVNENPETGAHVFWSPLESKAYFDHQMKVVRENARGMRQAMGAYGIPLLPDNRLWVSGLLVGIGAGLLMALLPVRLWQGTRWKMLWLSGTIVLYASGYLLVFFVARYVVPVALPLGLALCLLAAWQLARWAHIYTGAALVVLVSLGVGWGALEDLKPLWNRPANTWHRKIAAELRQRNLPGPIASSDRMKGMYVAFHAGRKFAGFPGTKDPALADRELSEYRPGMLLVWEKREKGDDDEDGEDSSLAESVVKRGRWKSVFASTFKKERVEVFVPIDAADKKGG